MAKDGADSIFDKDMVKKFLAKSKVEKAELNFAFGLAKKPEDGGLIIHPREPGRKLRKPLLADATIKKACFGTLTVVDSDILLKPVRPVQGMVKSLRLMLRNAGLAKYTPLLVDEGGNVLDEDNPPEGVGDNDDDAEVPAAAQTPDPGALKARLVAANGQIKELGPSAPPALAKALVTSANHLKNGEIDACVAGLTKLEAVLAAASIQKPMLQADTEATDLKAALMKQVNIIRDMPDGQEKAELGTLAKAAMQAISSGDMSAAAAALAELAEEMEGSDRKEAPDASSSEDVLEIWRDAKETVDEGISKLQDLLRGQDHPVLARIADMGLNGVTEGNQTALVKALFEFNAATGADKSKRSKDLQAQVGAYAEFLSSSPIVALVEDNPMGIAVPIRATLGSALRKISSTCKAAA